MQQPVTEARTRATPAVLGVTVGLVALAVLLSGLGDSGFWTDAELPVVDRSRAALGEQLSGLARSPWLPDAVRTAVYGLIPTEFGIRLPHAAAVAACGGLTAYLARRMGASIAGSLLGATVLLGMPAVAISGRTVLGNPIGELMVVVTVILGVTARRAASGRAAGSWWTLTAVSLGLAVASLGLLFGGAAPLLAMAMAAPAPPRRAVDRALVALAVVAIGTVLVSSLQQGDGYIPLLGAAKDLDLMERPEHRRYAAVLEDFGYQIFPWAGLAAAGAIVPRGRWFGLWVVATLGLAMPWSLAYGVITIPAAVPTALCVVAATETVLDPTTPRNLRRVTVLLGICTILVLRKDAELYPSRIAVPQHDFDGEYQFPDETITASQTLRSVGGALALGLLASAFLVRRRDEDPSPTTAVSPRIAVATGLLLLAAGYGSWALHHGLVPALGRTLSPREPLRRYEAWVEAGELVGPLAVHRVRDEGLALYGPPPASLRRLDSRHQLFEFLKDGGPRAALVRLNDVAPLHQNARLSDWSFYVLDDSNADLRLVSNTLPAGAPDRNRIPEVLADQRPVLGHETLVQFEKYVKVVGWEVTEPLIRGRRATLSVALEVLRPLPGGSKLYARFMDGRLSKFNHDPMDFGDGVYPCNLWRPGDFILHTQTVEVPPLEILPGRFDLIIGIRRSEHVNFQITVPEGREGEFGVEVRDKKHNFAKIGEVSVW